MERISASDFRRTTFSGGRSLPIFLKLFVILFVSGLTIGSSSAATLTWTGAVSSDWNNATNWSPQQVPTGADTAVINSGPVVAATNPLFSTLTFNGGTL